VHLTCGSIYEDLGRAYDARRAYEQARSLDPQNAAAHRRIARLDARARKWTGALRGYRRVLTLDPRSSVARQAIEDLVPEPFHPAAAASWGCTFAVAFITPSRADATTMHIAGAIGLAVVCGGVLLLIARLHRAVGPILWRILRNDKHARAIEAAILVSVLFLVALAETPLAYVGDYWGRVAVALGCFVFLGRRIRTTERSRRNAAPGRKRQDEPREGKLENGAEA
jgi:tetratricopeptide (TPR) repeat protein